MTQYVTRITVVLVLLAALLTLNQGVVAGEWEPSQVRAKQAKYSPRLFSQDAKTAETEWLRPITIREIAAEELKRARQSASSDSTIALVDFEEQADNSVAPIKVPPVSDSSVKEPDDDKSEDEVKPDTIGNDAEDDEDSDPTKGQKSVELDEDEKNDLGPFFRKSQSSFTWIPRGSESRGIGQISLAVEPTWALDFKSAESFELDGTLGGGIHFLSGPGRSDLPPRVYDFFMSTRAAMHLDSDVGVEATFNIGIHSDFETGSEGWRYPGRVLGYIGPPDGRFVFGIEYLDLQNLKVLPAGGFVLGDDESFFELYFPRVRLKSRTSESEEESTWNYISCEYHGDEWAIQRSFGRSDIATLTEYRLLFGFEEISKEDGQSSFSEIGWFFGRDLEYRSGIGSFQPHDAFMFRFGSRF